MPIVSTNFAKTLVWKHEYDVQLWHHEQWTRNKNDHHMPLNEPLPHEIFLCMPLLVLVVQMKFSLNKRVWTVFLKVEKQWDLSKLKTQVVTLSLINANSLYCSLWHTALRWHQVVHDIDCCAIVPINCSMTKQSITGICAVADDHLQTNQGMCCGDWLFSWPRFEKIWCCMVFHYSGVMVSSVFVNVVHIITLCSHACVICILYC